MQNKLPNNKKEGATYYFNYRFLNTENKSFSINQSIIISFENKDDKDDAFDVYQLRHIWVNNDGDATIDIYCYSDETAYTLVCNFDKS